VLRPAASAMRNESSGDGKNPQCRFGGEA